MQSLDQGPLALRPPTPIHLWLDLVDAATQSRAERRTTRAGLHLFAHMIRTPPPVRSPSLRRAK